MTRTRHVVLIIALGALGGPLAAQAPPWPEYHVESLGITFRHPATPGLRIEARAPTCAASDRTWQGGVPDSMIVVTRTAAPLVQIAAFFGIVRDGDHWVAEGYQGARAPVAVVNSGGWQGLVATAAVTVVYDMALRAPVPAKQWRLVALGPGREGCAPLIAAIATGLPAAWDSSVVAGVLRSARARVP